jgi:DNA-binding MarR family transcriptional regulator
MRHDSPVRDSIDEFIARLAQLPAEVRPDPDVEALVGRLHQLSYMFRRRMERSMKERRLVLSDLQILTRLRLADDLRCSPGALAKATWLTPGAITNRVGHLEGLGYVQREQAAGDRRGVVVVLTPSGREVWDTLVSKHARDEAAVAGILEPAEIRKLNDTLRTLLTGFDDDSPNGS